MMHLAICYSDVTLNAKLTLDSKRLVLTGTDSDINIFLWIFVQIIFVCFRYNVVIILFALQVDVAKTLSLRNNFHCLDHL